MSCVINIENLHFSYKENKTILNIDSLQVKEQERFFLYGPSGYGKSTLLNLIAGVLKPKNGTLDILGHDFMKLSAGKKDKIRGENIGYIFQSFNLIPWLTVSENILLPTQIHKINTKDPLNRMLQLTEDLEIAHLLNFKVTELSIGQQQRVAQARALIHRPKLVVADEPTSALDEINREKFMQLLIKEWEREKFTLFFVGHDTRLKEYFSHNVSLLDINKVN